LTRQIVCSCFLIVLVLSDFHRHPAQGPDCLIDLVVFVVFRFQILRNYWPVYPSARPAWWMSVTKGCLYNHCLERLLISHHAAGLNCIVNFEFQWRNIFTFWIWLLHPNWVRMNPSISCIFLWTFLQYLLNLFFIII